MQKEILQLFSYRMEPKLHVSKKKSSTTSRSVSTEELMAHNQLDIQQETTPSTSADTVDVLVVEDSAAQRKWLRKRLTAVAKRLDQSWNIHLFETAEEALTFVETRKLSVSLAFVDQYLGAGMQGNDFISLVREHPNLVDCVMIVCTSDPVEYAATSKKSASGSLEDALWRKPLPEEGEIVKRLSRLNYRKAAMSQNMDATLSPAITKAMTLTNDFESLNSMGSTSIDPSLSGVSTTDSTQEVVHVLLIQTHGSANLMKSPFVQSLLHTAQSMDQLWNIRAFDSEAAAIKIVESAPYLFTLVFVHADLQQFGDVDTDSSSSYSDRFLTFMNTLQAATVLEDAVFIGYSSDIDGASNNLLVRAGVDAVWTVSPADAADSNQQNFSRRLAKLVYCKEAVMEGLGAHNHQS